MSWLNHFYNDHMAVLNLLAKLEGNLKDLEVGLGRPNIHLEFEEFSEVIKKVILPHFKSEETGIYPKVAELSPSAKEIIDQMLEEHQTLYHAFEDYMNSVESMDNKGIINNGRNILRLLELHIRKEEETLPQLFKEANLLEKLR